MFIRSDFLTQRFGSSFRLLDAYLHAGQLLQQRTALLEAHQRGGAARHAQNSGSERKQFQAQRTIPRTESALTLGTVIVSSLQLQRTQHALERLVVASVILGLSAAGAGQFRPRMIAGIGVQPLLQSACGQSQRLPSRRHFDSFEIQIGNGLAA